LIISTSYTPVKQISCTRFRSILPRAQIAPMRCQTFRTSITLQSLSRQLPTLNFECYAELGAVLTRHGCLNNTPLLFMPLRALALLSEQPTNRVLKNCHSEEINGIWIVFHWILPLWVLLLHFPHISHSYVFAMKKRISSLGIKITFELPSLPII
jgi:hypothetical protein